MQPNVSVKELKPIPETEYAGSAYPDIRGKVRICPLHTKDRWMEGTYEWDNGAIVCPDCGWGTRVPGYMRLVEGKVVDLRIVSS